MKQNTPKLTVLLNGAIALLVLLITVQIYGVIFDSHPDRSVSKQNDQESAGVINMQINILNGCGVSGVGNSMTQYCRAAGYDVVEMGNYKSFDVNESMVIDRIGNLEDAKRLAAFLKIAPKNVVQQFSNDHLVSATVVIGNDYKNLSPWK